MNAFVVVAVSKLATGVFLVRRKLNRQNLHLDIPLSNGLRCDDRGANSAPNLRVGSAWWTLGVLVAGLVYMSLRHLV